MKRILSVKTRRIDGVIDRFPSKKNKFISANVTMNVLGFYAFLL